jgi:hypothetical protein
MLRQPEHFVMKITKGTIKINQSRKFIFHGLDHLAETGR